MIHEGYLIECLSLIRQSIDLNALNVVESTVTFICEIMQYQKQWKPYHAESYIQIIVSKLIYFKLTSINGFLYKILESINDWFILYNCIIITTKSYSKL